MLLVFRVSLLIFLFLLCLPLLSSILRLILVLLLCTLLLLLSLLALLWRSFPLLLPLLLLFPLLPLLPLSLLSSSAFCAFSCSGGFDPSSSSPWFSSFSSLVSSSLPLSASLGPSPSLLSVVSSVSSAPVSTLSSSAPFGSSSSLDYASFKAHVLGVSDEYLSLACWYNSVYGSAFLSSHCPYLSADVAKDFSSGSSVLLSTLRSSASLPSDRLASSLASLPSSSPSSSATPALTFFFFFFFMNGNTEWAKCALSRVCIP